jgi:hypothetical protein
MKKSSDSSYIGTGCDISIFGATFNSCLDDGNCAVLRTSGDLVFGKVHGHKFNGTAIQVGQGLSLVQRYAYLNYVNHGPFTGYNFSNGERTSGHIVRGKIQGEVIKVAVDNTRTIMPYADSKQCGEGVVLPPDEGAVNVPGGPSPPPYE